ncbi:MAG: TlpA family protein disulfide reductase [Polyangiaceae bacterium]|nr:TlpA family protein disulfide reductase [Polyangiaceae bacterium]
MASSAKRVLSSLRAGSALALVLVLVACGPSRPAGDPVGVSRGAEEGPVTFEYDSLDARPVSSQALRGKPSVVAFITTWDISSQAETDFLVAMAKNDHGAVNYALVALDDRKNRELVEEYARMLKVTFPVATADAETTMGKGGFGVMAVPTVVILDEESRVFFRKAGIVKSEEIRAQLAALEKRKTLRPR